MDGAQLALNLVAVPFGFPALYYGYKGYQATRGGLNAYRYFFIAMIFVGAIFLFDLLRLLGILKELEILLELAFLFASISFTLAFRDLLKFLSLHS